MKLLLLLVLSGLAVAQSSHQGQSGDTTYIAVPYNEFCGATVCGGGAFVHLYSTDAGFNAYRVAIRVTNDAGNTYQLVQLQDRAITSQWTNIQFQAGKIQSVRIVSITKLVTAGDVTVN
jgi:hypothetical protein